MQDIITKFAKNIKLSGNEESVVRSYFNRNSKDGSIQIDRFNILYICSLAKLLGSILNTALKNQNEIAIGDEKIPNIKIGITEDIEYSIKYLRTLITKQSIRYIIPYDFIAYYIFQDKNNYIHQEVEEAYENLVIGKNDEYFGVLDAEENLDSKQQECIEKVFNKIRRNILLAIHQKQYILDNIEGANQQVQEIKSEVKSVQSKANAILLRLQNVIGTYVAILGIFATILLAVVGGLNLLGSAAKYIRYKQEFILYISVGVFTLSLIIYFLFTWIDKLQGSKTTENQKDDSWIKKVENFFKNYGFFGFLLSLLLVILFSYFFDSKKLSTPLGNIPGPFSEAPYQYLGIWDIPPNKLSNIRFEEDN